MKKKLSSYCISAIQMSTDAIPFVIAFVIFLMSALTATFVASTKGWGTAGLLLAFAVSILLLGALYFFYQKLSEWTVTAFVTRGKQYAAHYILSYVRENYGNGALSKIAQAETVALLREYAKDGLPEEVRKYIQDQMNLQSLSDMVKALEHEKTKKLHTLVIEYCRLFFCGRVENYESLEYSLRKFLIDGRVELSNDKVVGGDSFTKSDIRVFCSNVQATCGMPVERMAKFQKVIFIHWFPDTPEASLISNFSKTGASKQLKVTENLTLEAIVDEKKNELNIK